MPKEKRDTEVSKTFKRPTNGANRNGVTPRPLKRTWFRIYATRNMTMSNKLMYIPNADTQNNPSVDYNNWLKRLDT